MVKRTMTISAGKDNHMHPGLYYILEKGISIAGSEDDPIATKDDAIAKIKDGLESAPRLASKAGTEDESLVLVTGWDNSKYELTRNDLQNLPVGIIVFNKSYHGAWTNTLAMEALALTPADAGVDETGFIYEQAILESLVRLKLDFEDYLEALRFWQDYLFSLGYVGVSDMCVNALEYVEAYAALEAEGELKLRVDLWYRPELIEEISKIESLAMDHCAGVKFVIDGALGVRTAHMNEPYFDDPNNYGMLWMAPNELEESIALALEHGAPSVACHAIGNGAIDVVLDVYERFQRSGINTYGWRIEHAEFVDYLQAVRAKKHGVTFSMQPCFIDDRSYGDRLGERINEINDFRMLVGRGGYEPGVDLLFGTDGMPPEYLYGIRSCWGISMDKAIAGFGPVGENDYIVIEGNPYDLKARVLETYLDGEKVYEASE